VISRIKTIDAHVGGQPLRLVVDGLPRLAGTTLARKRDWLRKRADRFRRGVLLAPRGHVDLRGAVLTEPESPGSHAGVIFMDADGYGAMSGHGIIGVTTIALERGLLHAGAAVIAFDTPAGTVHARALIEPRGSATRVGSVAFTNIPAFVHAAAQPVRLGSRELRVDIAFGGLFYAIVDVEAIGVPLTPARLPDLSRLAVDICRALDLSGPVVHPADPVLHGVAGVIFTGPPQDPEADLRNVTVTAGGRVNHSPGGTSTAAVMAVLDAMDMLPGDRPFVHEGLIGSLFRGRPVRRTIVGDNPAIITEIEGTAWITGEHTFFLDEEDPFREGVPL
jgi:proline racemase